MFRRVLVMMDFSEAALEALRVTRERFAHADVTLLHVIEENAGLSDAFRTPSAGIGAPEISRSRGRTAWEHEALTRLSELGGGEVTRGDPARIALDVASRGECDLIVLGVARSGRLERLLFRSVTARVLQASPVPVLTVRAPNTPGGAA